MSRDDDLSAFTLHHATELTKFFFHTLNSIILV